MLLSKISLRHFRNFEDKSFGIDPSLTIVVGENARGKTNLLESIYFSVFGSGFRESKEEELLTWGEEKAYIDSQWDDNGIKKEFMIYLNNKDGIVEKKFYINKTQKSHYQYKQLLTKAVLFTPEHIDIISGGPDKRRDYFNRVISGFDLDYKKKLVNYEQALKKRNKLYEYYSNENTLKEEIIFWNNYLIEHAAFITQKRQKYLDYLNQHQTIEGRGFEIVYAKNEFNQERIDKYFELEKKVRKTMFGPQKDDFQIYLEEEVKENVHLYGSRSEQRMAVFWLKLNEINYIEEALKVKPILLLDDVFSEFDKKNKQLILELIFKYQTVLTTTEAELIELSTDSKTVINF